jgi:hypothetical protein
LRDRIKKTVLEIAFGMRGSSVSAVKIVKWIDGSAAACANSALAM